jgi:hypothetical protein
MAVRTGPQPMPGMMPPMPGIMGAPMGPPPGMPPMGGMPGMLPMPMGGMPPPMPMPMGGPMGGPPPGPQGGRPASLGTLPAPSTAAQRAGFGAAVGAVASGPVAGAMPADVFAGGIPGGMMDASIPRPVAMMRGGGAVQYMQEGGAPRIGTTQAVLAEAQKIDPSIQNMTDYYRRVGEAIRASDIPLMNALQNASFRGLGQPERSDPHAETMAVVRETPGYKIIKSSLGPNVQLKADYGVPDIEAYNREFYKDIMSPYEFSRSELTSMLGGAGGAGYATGPGAAASGSGSAVSSGADLTDLNAALGSSLYSSAPVGGGGFGSEFAEYFPVTSLPQGASYQPTMGTIPTFTRGMSDVFGTRPVTYYGSPAARITGGIGSIDLPARPESVNILDWLGTPPVRVYGGAS